MIEVSARLPRGPVFLAGETLRCEIVFTNISRDNDLEVDTVAWSSVQLICQCSVSESRVQLPKTQIMSTEEASSTGCDTSFVPSKGERGLTVLCTKPKILFCDLKLQPGESRTFEYEDAIPTDAPPSFRGQAVKYSYKFIIGTQRPGSTTKLLRIPFRVMVMPGLNDLSVYNETDEIRPSNPFLHNQGKENSVLDIALQVMATVTARKAPHSYNITNAKGKVAKFLLFKQAFKLGEDIVGIFDFSEGTVPCVQFSVTLQSEEQISEECRRKPGQGSAITSYVKQQEMCLHTVHTYINLPIPLTATPAFMTDIGRNREITKASLSCWIQVVIRRAHAHAAARGDTALSLLLMAARACEVRASVATLAAAQSTARHLVLQAAYWQSEDPFINCYVRDFSCHRKDGTFGVGAAVCQRWRLHFEFVTSLSSLSTAEDLAANAEQGGQWRGPATLDVETMVWDLPIKVFPTNPLHASSVTLLKTDCTILV